jgi:Lipocalin-like domain
VARAHPAVTAVRAALVLAVCGAGLAGCGARRRAAPWIGTWNMTAVESRDSAAGPWRRPFGEAPYGYVTYNADGTHTMNFTRTPVPAMFAAGSDRGGTEAELRATYEGYFSWFGRYTVDPVRGIITHRIEGSLWPSWRNTVQERPFAIRGDTLFLGDLVRSRRVLVRVR